VTLTISSQNQDGSDRRLEATLELKGDRVSIKWERGSGQLRRMLEQRVVRDRRGLVGPDDGKRFFEALPAYFSRSSTIVVEQS